MIHAQSYSPSVPMAPRQRSAFFAPLVDRATALALRRTTARAGRGGKKHGSTPVPSGFSTPTIRHLPAPLAASSIDVPVVIVPDPSSVGVARAARPQPLLARLRSDLSWMTALFIALSVTLALAIPLELFRQNG
jgi:hypothetical protein